MNEIERLRHLVAEVRRARPPDFDWDRIETRVVDQIEREPRPPARRERLPWGRLAAVASLAAAMAAAVSSFSGRESATRNPLVRNAPASSALGIVLPVLSDSFVDAAVLREGDWLAANGGSVTVEHDGRVAWKLGVGGGVVIERLRPTIVVSLEHGSVRAEVAPDSGIDSFVVLVGDMAVSVHGTVFSVERRDDRVRVRVERGTVAVGPHARRGQVAQWLLAAPMRASFSVDGTRIASFEPYDWDLATSEPPVRQNDDIGRPARLDSAAAKEDKERRRPVLSGAAPSPSIPAAAASARSSHIVAQERAPELPEELTAEQARSALDSITTQIGECHRKLPVSSSNPEVKISVHTTLLLTVAPDGHMTMGRFEPPLSPAASACASEILWRARFPLAKGASQLRVELRF